LIRMGFVEEVCLSKSQYIFAPTDIVLNATWRA
jgi:hypothetical protein